MKLQDRTFTLNKAQIKKLIAQGFATPHLIVLPENISDDVVILGRFGEQIGTLTLRAWMAAF